MRWFRLRWSNDAWSIWLVGLCFFLYASSLVTSYYLAIYFQGVRGKMPALSGVYMLPGIVSQMISGVVGGFGGMLDLPIVSKCFKVNLLIS